MQTDDGPLLLLVQANVAPEHEEAFNAWYYHHVPRLLEIPGFNWGRRYVGVRGTIKYLALYELEDAAVLGRMYGPEGRDARAIDERAKFDALQGLTDVRSNVYIQRSGTHLSHPLLREDKVVSIVMCDCVVPEQEAAFNDKEPARVKKVCKQLLEILKTEKLVLDWRSKARAKGEVKTTIEKLLDQELPEKYDETLYETKCEATYRYIYDSYSGSGESVYG